MINVAINGFGRIGRTAFKAGFDRKEINFVAINDLTDTKTLAHLLKYDSTYGKYDKKIKHDSNHLIIDGKKIPVFSEREPGKLPWKKMKVDVVLECTGFFVTEEGSMPHIDAGAKKVIISAPAKGGNVPTYLIGVNEDKMKKDEPIISNASCTTNCIAPVVNILKDTIGLKKLLLTTVHAYTAGAQVLQDGPKKDLRKGRAAAVSMIPTTTGAAIATTKVIPELEGKFDGLAVRVPIIIGSLSDITLVTEKRTSVEEINSIFKKAVKQSKYKGIVGITEEPLVSCDFIGSTYSCIVDLSFTKVVDGDLVKIFAWYDNEWAYSHRLVELAILSGKKFKK